MVYYDEVKGWWRGYEGGKCEGGGVVIFGGGMDGL